MQDKKGSLLKNIRNFNKKVLSGNQALHKNEVTAKKNRRQCQSNFCCH